MKSIPGPWTVYEDKDIIVIMTPKCDTARMIRYKERGDLQRARRDARLMSAAPDLLAALVKIVNNWDNLHPYDRSQARAAIAKAKGEVLR